MAGESTKVHGPSESRTDVTELYARCQVCGVQWQLWGDPASNAEGCAFCGAPADAVRVLSED